jgi:MFS family permease
MTAQLLVGLAGGIVLFLVPIELRAAGAGPAATGLAFTSSSILYIAVSATFVTLGRRGSLQRWLAPAAVALTLGLFPGVLNGRPVTVITALVLSMAARAAIVTITFAAVPEIGKRIGLGDGVIIGIFNTAWAVGMLFAPLVAGVVDQTAGAHIAYLTAVIPCAIGATCLLAPRLAELGPGRAMFTTQARRVLVARSRA